MTSPQHLHKTIVFVNHALMIFLQNILMIYLFVHLFFLLLHPASEEATGGYENGERGIEKGDLKVFAL
jgi:hypothetical protein